MPRLGQRFFGLFGPMGPLPLHLSEYVRERERHHADPALARFADTFHHRALLLFYRAWAQSQPTVHLDRRSDDAFSRWTGAVAGLAQPEFEQADSLTADAKRHRAAHPRAQRAHRRRHDQAAARLVRRAGATGVVRRPLVAGARGRPHAPRARATHPQPRNVLGHSAVAGDRVWDRQYKFRLHLGPLTLAQYRQFLPGQRSIAELRDWVRQYVGLGLTFDVVAHAARCAGAAPAPRPPRANACAARLDRRWLGQRRAHGDRSDLRLSPARLSRFKEPSHG